MRISIYIQHKKTIAILFIVLSAMSFSLPKETFDPHLGVDYDIFCQLSSYIIIDKILNSYQLPKLFSIEKLITYITQLIITLFSKVYSARAPPLGYAF